MQFIAKPYKINVSYCITIPRQYIKDGSINPALPVKVSIESNFQTQEDAKE